MSNTGHYGALTPAAAPVVVRRERKCAAAALFLLFYFGMEENRRVARSGQERDVKAHLILNTWQTPDPQTPILQTRHPADRYVL